MKRILNKKLKEADQVQELRTQVVFALNNLLEIIEDGRRKNILVNFRLGQKESGRFVIQELHVGKS